MQIVIVHKCTLMRFESKSQVKVKYNVVPSNRI